MIWNGYEKVAGRPSCALDGVIGDVQRRERRTDDEAVLNQTLAYEMAEGNHELLLFIIEFFFIPLKIE